MQGSDGERGSDATSNEALLVDRRSYLKLAGVAVGSVPLLAGRTSAAFERHGIRFERTVDMVRDAGCDPSGREPCDAKIREAAADYTLLKFPPGEYKITKKNVIFDKTNLGFLGVGDVRFTVPEWYDDKMFIVERGTGLLFEGIDIDQRAYGATPGLHLAAEDDLWIQDVEYIGQGEDPDSFAQDCANEQVEGCHGNEGVTDALYPMVRSPDGVGVVKNVVARNGGVMGSYTRIGVWIGAMTEGRIRLEDCEFSEFSGNGLYCSRTYGVVEVEGGRFRNNDISQVRLGSQGSYVENARIEVDAAGSESPNPWDALNQRGVWFESRKYGGNGPEVRDCDIAIVATPNSSGGVVTASTVDDFSVRDTRIGIDADGVRGVSGYAPTGEAHSAALDGVSVTGSAANSQAIWLKNHYDSAIENCCIHQEGASRVGVWLDNSPGTVVRDSTIDVTGRQVVEESCQATVIDIADSGSCSMPDLTGLPHTLSISSNGGRYSYTFTVSGDLNGGDKADPNDTISGNMASGQGGGSGIDNFEFSGEVAALELNGDATLSIDGERVNPGRFPDNALSIEGNGGRYSYTFAVSGNLERGDKADPNDTVSGNTASGQGGDGGIDSYVFSGEILAFDLDGDATAYLNGERINPTDYSGNTITIQGIDGTVRYDFSATGSVGENYGVEQQWADNIDGSTASGVVGPSKDSYVFSGDLVHLDVDGRAKVHLNGERINPTDYPNNVLTVQGVNDTVRYDFSVTGSVGENYGVEQQWADRANDNTGGGVVGRGKDSYVFSGELVRLDVDGQAAVHLNGERIDPADYPDSVLTVEGVSDTVRYDFSATGSVGENYGVEQQWADNIDGSTGGGVVGRGRDSYTFSGNIERLVVDSRARIEVDRSARTISVSGTGRFARYRLAVTGSIRRTNSVDSGDDISGGTASGIISPGTDTYRYTGEIRELSIDDYVSVTVS